MALRHEGARVASSRWVRVSERTSVVDGKTHTPIGYAEAGDRLRMQRTDGDWVLVADGRRRFGWIPTASTVAPDRGGQPPEDGPAPPHGCLVGLSWLAGLALFVFAWAAGDVNDWLGLSIDSPRQFLAAAALGSVVGIAVPHLIHTNRTRPWLKPPDQRA